jgi:tRNA(Ile)-lysidine synthase
MCSMQTADLPRQYLVVAVSGGVDSVALLDILAAQGRARLIVAHFDHGIRDDSHDDRLFVQKLAGTYGLPFVYNEGRLGAKASEATAREARYAFLRRVKEISGATAIATAHHEDDLLETAILNLLRGTGRKGLSSLQSTEEIYRPLLNTPKAHIITYAQAHGLAWHEDSTNADQNYLRNYVRQRLLTRFDEVSRRRLRELIDAATLTNAELDRLLIGQLAYQPAHDELDRQWFISLPHLVAREIVAVWLREHGITGFDKKAIERIVTMAKTLMPGKTIDVNGNHIVVIKPKILALSLRDR